MQLIIDTLTKTYGDKKAVNALSCTLESGVYGLLGANGAGKTTLLRMLCGVQQPTSGNILLDGKSIESLGERYRAQLGYLPQHFGYYPGFSAKDFMMYIAAIKGIEHGAAKVQTESLLRKVRLDDVAKKKIKTFSGGMKQRLGIAQALLGNPNILVLDEPTAGLDPKERIFFRNLIEEYAQNRLVLLSTHIVSDVDSIANQILIMKAGRIIQMGDRAEILRPMEGKVWTVDADGELTRKMERQHLISDRRHEGALTRLRILSDMQPADNAMPETANLEDLYMYHFDDEERGGNA